MFKNVYIQSYNIYIDRQIHQIMYLREIVIQVNKSGVPQGHFNSHQFMGKVKTFETTLIPIKKALVKSYVILKYSHLKVAKQIDICGHGKSLDVLQIYFGNQVLDFFCSLIWIFIYDTFNRGRLQASILQEKLVGGFDGDTPSSPTLVRIPNLAAKLLKAPDSLQLLSSMAQELSRVRVSILVFAVLREKRRPGAAPLSLTGCLHSLSVRFRC